MITRTGARLLDFGLARSVAGRRLVQRPRWATTPAARHGSPPKARSSARSRTWRRSRSTGGEIDTRADVFAFGAVLFEMVTGLKAFEGEIAGARDERHPARRAGTRLVDRSGDAGRARSADPRLPRQGSERALAEHLGRRAAAAPPARDDERRRNRGRCPHPAPLPRPRCCRRRHQRRADDSRALPMLAGPPRPSSRRRRSGSPSTSACARRRPRPRRRWRCTR